ncbi:hypothetical protein BE20_52025 [Sorangium cellulosum]|uniref:NADP-dependent oxidoreductase domain-containing protein n=1 Tax=Sorangium cellulosum TaxID=56 RepID=A0A150RML6_SORCE|nr:hypothetical protein BE18_43220 [Sorangium cellulosum]KYG01957.1 hypothetical protein BE20_52025 [Sorangium cellulosum]
MSEVRLGKGGPSVFPIALGGMGMGAGSWYGAADEAESIATIHEALERGANVLDTGDFYGMGKNGSSSDSGFALFVACYR